MSYWRLRRSVRVLLVDDEDRLLTLLVEGHEGRYHELPGGGMDPGETWRDAARREVREETGFDDIELREVVARRWAEYRRPHGRVGQDELVVRARLVSERRVAIDPATQDDGVIDLVWLSRTDLADADIATDPAHPSLLAAVAGEPAALPTRAYAGLDPLGPDIERYARHAIELSARWGRSRYDGAVHADAARLLPASWIAVAAHLRAPAGDRAQLRTVELPTGAADDVRPHPAETIRVASTASDHDQAAVALSAASDTDLEVVRPILGPNVGAVDGVTRLVAVRGEQVIGSVVLALTEDPLDGELVASLQTLAVAPRWRGRGTGLALAARALQLAAAAGAPRAYAELLPGTDRLLTRLGFHPTTDASPPR